MRHLIISTLLFLCSSFSYADVLYCLTISDATIATDGKKVDSQVFEAKDAYDPENWFEFNLSANTTSYFWSEEDGTKGTDTDALTKINDRLYYATIKEPDYIGYTTYLFESNLKDGHLAEEGYFAKFKCIKQNQKKIEQLYKISFKPYYE